MLEYFQQHEVEAVVNKQKLTSRPRNSQLCERVRLENVTGIRPSSLLRKYLDMISRLKLKSFFSRKQWAYNTRDEPSIVQLQMYGNRKQLCRLSYKTEGFGQFPMK